MSPLPIARTPTVTNKTLTSADTEYSHAFATGTKYFSIQCRTSFDVRYAWVTGKVAGPTAPYMTMKSGGAKNSPENLVIPAATTLYLASSEAGVVVEIEEWA